VQLVVTFTTVALLSVSTVAFPVTHTGPARVELAVGPFACSSKYRCDWAFRPAERPDEVAASMVELRTRTIEPCCTRTSHGGRVRNGKSFDLGYATVADEYPCSEISLDVEVGAARCQKPRRVVPDLDPDIEARDGSTVDVEAARGRSQDPGESGACGGAGTAMAVRSACTRLEEPPVPQLTVYEVAQSGPDPSPSNTMAGSQTGFRMVSSC
jgi:hypothetical protein